MKAILEFDLPEENQDFQASVNGRNYQSGIWEFNQWLRSEMKYKDDAEFDTKIKNRDVSFKSPATFKKFIANRYMKSSEDTMFPIVPKLN